MGKNADSYFLMEKETQGRTPAELMCFNHNLHSQVKLYRNVCTFLLYIEYCTKNNADSFNLLSSFSRTVDSISSTRLGYVMYSQTLLQCLIITTRKRSATFFVR